MMKCVFCGEEIPSIRVGYRKVTGWEHYRDAGGTNALALPERHDEWACEHCIDRQRRGLSVEQQSLLG